MLLDDRGYVTLLKLYPTRAGYRYGPAFRTSINGNGGPLSYDVAHHRWENYCEVADAEIRAARRRRDRANR
ncbi:hypothetical protein [Nonomuraea sp. NPDC049784]|uniref:hypothetical protein n=1 Tax=Nonomuraea sp. NPDC049784 TaxID=3154361 RepID=UPI0033E7D0F4